MTARLLAFLVSLSPLLALASDPPDVAEPRFAADSQWTFHSVGGQGSRIEESDVQWKLIGKNNSGEWIFWRGKPVASAAPSGAAIQATTGVTGTSWDGRDTTGPEQRHEIPLSFPLSVGKTWNVTFDRQAGTSWLHGERHYTVVGWEDVIVPGGAFRALKIAMDGGNWRIDPVPAGQHAARPDRPADLAMTQESWYVPDVQNVVREIDDASAPNVKSHRHFVLELTSFALGH